MKVGVFLQPASHRKLLRKLGFEILLKPRDIPLLLNTHWRDKAIDTGVDNVGADIRDHLRNIVLIQQLVTL